MSRKKMDLLRKDKRGNIHCIICINRTVQHPQRGNVSVVRVQGDGGGYRSRSTAQRAESRSILFHRILKYCVTGSRRDL